MTQARPNRLLRWLGGHYITLSLALAFLSWLPFFGLAGLSLHINAELTKENILTLLRFGLPVFSSLGFLSMLWLWLQSSQARKNLSALLADNKTSLPPDEEARGWGEITAIVRRYAISVAVVSLVQIAIAYLYAQRYDFITPERQVYLLLAMFSSMTAATLGSALWLENLIRPALIILQPADYARQIAALRPNLRLRWLGYTLGLILVGLLFLAPIGYHQTYTVLYREIGSSRVLRDLQVQSILATVGALILGALYTYQLTNQTQRPIRRLIDIFQQVEQGDLSQRAPIDRTNELGMLSVYFNRMIEQLQSFQETLEEQIEKRTTQLQTLHDVGRTASAILDPDELMQKVVQLISERFDYYYTAIFLIDEERRWAELKAASGEAGKILMQRRHRLPLDGHSMVSTAIQLQQPRISLDAKEGSTPRFDNPFLPYTRSEIALPLIVGERVIGALDVQSTRENAFSQSDINALQGMASQLAIAISNAQTFQEMRQALNELQTFQQQYLLGAWSDMVAARGEIAYRIGEEMPETEKETLHVPLSLRDQVLGEIILEGENLDDEDRAWAEALATQAVVALENARLLEESQRTALRERLIAEISQKIWSARSIDSILKTAIQELGQALQAAEVSIELEAEGGPSNDQ